jgi:hypothetical protein
VAWLHFWRMVERLLDPTLHTAEADEAMDEEERKSESTATIHHCTLGTILGLGSF